MRRPGRRCPRRGSSADQLPGERLVDPLAADGGDDGRPVVGHRIGPRVAGVLADDPDVWRGQAEGEIGVDVRRRVTEAVVEDIALRGEVLEVLELVRSDAA